MSRNRTASIIATVVIGGVSVFGAASSALSGPGVSSDDIRDTVEEHIGDFGPNAKLSDWSCPSDKISIDDGTTVYCKGTIHTLGTPVPHRFRVTAEDDGYSVEPIAVLR